MKNTYLIIIAFIHLMLIPSFYILASSKIITSYMYYIAIPLLAILFIINLVCHLIKNKKLLDWPFGILYISLLVFSIFSITQTYNKDDITDVTFCIVISFILSVIIFHILKRKNKDVSFFAISFNALILALIIDFTCFK